MGFEHFIKYLGLEILNILNFITIGLMIHAGPLHVFRYMFVIRIQDCNGR